jgi:hypothetical protein
MYDKFDTTYQVTKNLVFWKESIALSVDRWNSMNMRVLRWSSIAISIVLSSAHGNHGELASNLLVSSDPDAIILEKTI